MIETVLEKEMMSLKQKSLYRELRVLQSSDKNRARLKDEEIILFCGNDYLGLSHHPRILEVTKKAIDEEGVGTGASRLISGTTQAHQDLEQTIAEVKEKERALVFSSGYMANVAAITTLAGKEDLIVMDKLCHASIIDGVKLSGAAFRVYPHLNYDKCESILQKAEGYKRKIIISETLFSMDGDFADLHKLIRLKKEYDALLIVDDAHGTGVLGETGKGALENSGLAREVDVIVGTLSKAIGALGGFVASSEKTIEYLINRARPFIFATSLPAHLCVAAKEAFEIFQTSPLREKLWKNINRIKSALKSQGYELPEYDSPILPVIIGDEARALEIAERLLKEGFFVPAIRTPTVAKGSARLRVTVSATHEEQDIDNLLAAFERIQKDMMRRGGSL